VILPSRKTRRNGVAIRLGAAALVAALAPVSGGAASGSGASGSIRLPAPSDAAALNTVVLQPRPGEVETSKLPGPVTDREQVHAGLGSDGSLRSVVVDQTLTIHGVGDFDLVMPRMAKTIVGPSDQAVQPGLRRGEILWNGFSPGRRVLRSTVTLDRTLERLRIPITVSVRVLRGGRPVTPPVTGPVEIQVRISNATARVITLARGDVSTAALGGLLDRLRAQVAAGRGPIAGRKGIPKSLAAARTLPSVVQPVQIPLSVTGSITFPVGFIAGATITGATPGSKGANPSAEIQTLLPSARETDGSLLVRITGVAAGLGAPHIELMGQPSLPDVAALTPPSGGSWKTSLDGLDAEGLGDALVRAEAAMWQVLLRPQIDAYVGNPGTGSSATTYSFVTAPPSRAAPRAATEHFRPWALALVLVAAAMVLGNATLLWRRS